MVAFGHYGGYAASHQNGPGSVEQAEKQTSNVSWLKKQMPLVVGGQNPAGKASRISASLPNITS